MIEVLREINIKEVMWAIPMIFFLHEMEEWNIYDWYYSNYQTKLPSTKLSIRLWLWLISICGFVVTSISFVIPNKLISGIIILILIVSSSFNGLQHIYWTFIFKKYAPGVLWSSLGIIAGGIITSAIVIQHQVPIVLILILYLITIPLLIQTVRAKKTLNKMFFQLHNLTVKISNIFEN
ncbi:MAG TPA: HXXEE domain-containing protein [Lachnospiraceae bacterium]|nr:HXXEE domain-containing protein [Lachnospiraceae bacterium]